MPLSENLYVGTSSWSCQDWLGSFYPAAAQPADFIQYYARHFRAVEIETTFYSIPAPQLVIAWKERTPPGFIFSARVPSVVTHQKVLQDCRQEFTAFLKTMELLEDRLGPLLLQFPYFNKDVFVSRRQFDKHLLPFLKSLPKDFKFALEIRNKTWITWDFLELLREHSVAFVVVAQAWMPSIDVLARALDLVTGEVFYARFVGDRKAGDDRSGPWNKLSEDKSGEMTVWVEEIRKIVARGVQTYAFFNNQYAGFAPGSAKHFEDLWRES